MALCDFEMYFDKIIEQRCDSWRRTIDLWFQGLKTFEIYITPCAKPHEYIDILQILRLKVATRPATSK